MVMDFVQVSEEEGDEPIELPYEEDGTLLLSTLQAQFPGSCGLKYRNLNTKAVRGVRSNEGKLFPPDVDSEWGEYHYFCVFPKENKRKSDDSLENTTAKTKRLETRLRCTDLIVLSLNWKTTEESFREYFETYGEVLVAQIKKDKLGKSRGFGFVRFGSYDAQMRVLSSRHLIDGRWCEVKVPTSKGVDHELPCKVFVGRCTEEINADDLREYFSKFGEVTDVFIPRPFRAFSFVTFLDPDVAQSLCGEDHIIKGASVHVSNAAPKAEQNKNQQGQSYNNTGRNGYQRGNNQRSSYGGENSIIGNDGNNSTTGYGMGDNNYGGNSGEGYHANGNNNYSNNGKGNRQDGESQYSNRHTNFQGMKQAYGRKVGGNSNLMNQGNMDMPNLQALGLNSQGLNSSNQGPNMLNLNSLPINPALIAAALSQWGLIGNQLQNQSQDH
ncbi:TAR DNA-binding protein 43-like [Drosophila eugracilis]|uniref:TAR DNA-binding protein 43-like n=1 Tax=Drosophila eugracilis TaxID=29029 RepID=UPI0007E611F6|nr:TAR DNA-binding protein 43-like [Drosophila eugracilis]XP_017070222.2 TAR DNA-binding protein 43-like [Drosophila eugracilis]XP_017070223.2 TAR DNA-binding protein 43-like [Drosophila eugracilis]XP_017070225.1 TAR DNA-binding protein 43-like [Drosophila eugracilis]